MAIRWLCGAAALVLLSGCKPDAAPPANQAANVAEPVAPAPVANDVVAGNSTAEPADGLRGWLVGSWSYGADCATDFAVHYGPDGSLNNYEDEGSWSVSGDTVTETITHRVVMGEDAPQVVNPPEVRRYTVTQIDRTHGKLRFEGRTIPILRC